MQPFSLTELLTLASDPMAYLTQPLPQLVRPLDYEARYAFELGRLQASEGMDSPDGGWTTLPGDGPEVAEYLRGFAVGFAERRAA
jgi:hypothetical protein